MPERLAERADKYGTGTGDGSKVTTIQFRDVCPKCGARRTDAQIGLEQSPDAYVAEMVAVFREVRRVLRDDGSVFLNLGDSYAGGGRGGNPAESPFRKQATNVGSLIAPSKLPNGIKPKDLIGLPWMVAFALRADGWYLRSDIIWAKRNCMPESVRDRPTTAHEHIFLLTKQPKYFYDAVAIEEEGEIAAGTRGAKGSVERAQQANGRPPEYAIYTGKRNKRSVWWMATQPFAEAHFATFPAELAETCIKAGTSERGCCSACGAPWVRQVAHEVVPGPKAAKTFVVDERDAAADANDQGANRQKDGHRPGYQSQNTTIGWLPSCGCETAVTPCAVLDPFSGAGTTALVADRLGRNAIGIELNADYVAMSERRLHRDAGLFADVAAQ